MRFSNSEVVIDFRKRALIKKMSEFVTSPVNINTLVSNQGSNP